ncbi:MAG: NAD(P)/FAD-dependent oxidoreductase [Mariprofundaceae bacterium]
MPNYVQALCDVMCLAWKGSDHMQDFRDITVIGAGPAGMFAVFEAGMHELTCHLVDSLTELGGQLAALYPDKPIYDIPGFPEIKASALCRRLHEQMAPMGPAIHLGQTVVDIHRDGDDFVCCTDTGQRLRSRAVFIAAGKGAFAPHKPTVPGGLDAYEDKSVFYAVKDSKAMLGKRIAVQGGGDSALDWAVELAEQGCQITLIHRRDSYRAHAKTVTRFKGLAASGQAAILAPGLVRWIEGDAESGQIRALKVQTPGGLQHLEIDVWLPLLGHTSHLGPIKQWGLTMEHGRVEVAAHSMESSNAGIYALGDIADYPGKCSLILTGFAEAATAVKDAYRYCKPNQMFVEEYSTTTGVRTGSSDE